MGILTSILGFPAKAPVSGVAWVAGKLVEAAEAQFYDPEAIKNSLVALEENLEAGRISEEEYEEREMELLLRLKEARKASA